LADALGEERGSNIQKVVDEVFNLFTPKACHKWLPWGGELLFSDLPEEVEREICEAEAKRQVEEMEAAAARKFAEEEESRRVAAQAKAERLEVCRAALGEARRAAMLTFRAKTLSKEGLQQWNTELADEASAISKAEAGEEDESAWKEDDQVTDLPVVVVGKRKAGAQDEVDEGEEEVNLETKWARYASSGLLEFEGPVHFIFWLNV
jgi:hypothetical protein